MTETDRSTLIAEIEGIKMDYNTMIAEFLDAQQRRIKCTAWKDMADRTKARYERLEKLIK